MTNTISTVKGLKSEIVQIIPFLIESQITFLYNPENVELITQSGPIIIMAITERLCLNVQINHKFTSKSLKNFQP